MYGILFKKTETKKTGKGSVMHDIDYMDETSKEHNQRRMIRDDIAYLMKELDGTVHCFGYIRDEIRKVIGAAPETLENEERKAMITNYLDYKTQSTGGPFRKKYIAHKLVFSLSSDLEELCENNGIDAEDMLFKQVKQTMNSWRNKWHKGDQFGYALGVHHDTEHLHIHVYLHNKTRDNKYIACSQGLSNKNSKYQQEDQFNFIKDRLNKFEDKLREKLRYMNTYNKSYDKSKSKEFSEAKEEFKETVKDALKSESKSRTKKDVNESNKEYSYGYDYKYSKISNFEKVKVVSKHKNTYQKIRDLERELNEDLKRFNDASRVHNELFYELTSKKKEVKGIIDKIREKYSSDLTNEDYKDNFLGGHISRLSKDSSDTYSDWYNRTLGGHVTRSIKFENKRQLAYKKEVEAINLNADKSYQEIKNRINLSYENKSRLQKTYSSNRYKYKSESDKFVLNLYLDKNPQFKTNYFAVLKSLKDTRDFGGNITAQKEWLTDLSNQAFDDFVDGNLDDIGIFNMKKVRDNISSVKQEFNIHFNKKSNEQRTRKGEAINGL